VKAADVELWIDRREASVWSSISDDAQLRPPRHVFRVQHASLSEPQRRRTDTACDDVRETAVALYDDVITICAVIRDDTDTNDLRIHL